MRSPKWYRHEEGAFFFSPPPNVFRCTPLSTVVRFQASEARRSPWVLPRCFCSLTTLSPHHYARARDARFVRPDARRSPDAPLRRLRARPRRAVPQLGRRGGPRGSPARLLHRRPGQLLRQAVQEPCGAARLLPRIHRRHRVGRTGAKRAPRGGYRRERDGDGDDGDGDGETRAPLSFQPLPRTKKKNQKTRVPAPHFPASTLLFLRSSARFAASTVRAARVSGAAPSASSSTSPGTSPGAGRSRSIGFDTRFETTRSASSRDAAPRSTS